MTKHAITREDILPLADYARVRDERRRRMAEFKRDRRLAVGPDITFYFENYDTMLHQVHEMLTVEKGGEAQIDDELRAYNPLIPNGSELVATMMIEIDEPRRRDRVLRTLGGIEESIDLIVGEVAIRAVPEADVERTTAEGKTSSIHFIRFPFSAPQIAAFRRADTRVIVGIGHANYQHMAVMPEAVRAALARDFS
ncbi:MAG: DUF3501 family protein [Rhodospirillales bacterium]|jgi:hypothetical protein|nr:DUF3501 family protein [Rhodospirillales bacterium]